MRNQSVAIVALAIALTSGSACGMAQSTESLRGCRVMGAEKLPDDLGGERGICVALEQAAAAKAPGVAYSADIRILSRNMISATVTLAGGQVLPEQKMAISDSPLRRSAIARFMESLAERIAEAS